MTLLAGKGWLLSKHALILALILFGGVNLAIIGWWHVANFSDPYAHVDSIIPIAVKDRILAAGWPDSNWVRAGLPDWARYDQFNFSSYILTFTEFDRLSPLEDRFDLALLSILCWVASIAIMSWSTARRLGLLAGAVIFCGMTVTPLLVQDSFYGRPETFLTLISVLVFTLSTRDRWASQIVAGVIAGAGLACKISFAPFAVAAILAPMLLRGPSGWVRSSMSVPAVVVGFALGAPGAVIDPAAFLNGVEHLRAQYSGFHWPHGSVEEGLFPQAVHAAGYFVGTLGILGVLVLASAAAAHAAVVVGPRHGPTPFEDDRLCTLAFCTVAAATVIFFSIQRTFFERNVSHAFPMLWYSVAWIISALATGRIAPRLRLVRIAASVALVSAMIPMSLLSLRIAHFIGGRAAHPAEAMYQAAERDIAENYSELNKAVSFAWREKEVLPAICTSLNEASLPTVLKLITGHAPRNGARVSDSRVEPIVSARGAFDDLPLSTLQTYHSAEVEYYLLKPGISSGPSDCNALP